MKSIYKILLGIIIVAGFSYSSKAFSIYEQYASANGKPVILIPDSLEAYGAFNSWGGASVNTQITQYKYDYYHYLTTTQLFNAGLNVSNPNYFKYLGKITLNNCVYRAFQFIINYVSSKLCTLVQDL